MVLLSVVVPTYQRGPQVEAQLQAYLDALSAGAARTHTRFECIVVDDHSGDGTFERLQARFGPRQEVRVLQMPANAGPGPARNAGAALAQGRWVWFLDDDDRLDADQVAPLIEALQQAPAEVDVVSHSLKLAHGADPRRNRHELARQVMAYREHQEVFRHVVRRALLEQHGIRFSPGLHEDIRHVVEVLLRARGVLTLPQTVVLKQKTEGAITARMGTARIDGYVQAYEETRRLLAGSEWGTPRQRQTLLTQTLGVLLLLVTREPDTAQALSFLAHLHRLSQRPDTPWAQDLAALPDHGPQATNFAYAGAVWRARVQPADQDLLDRLRAVFASRLSCKDLDSSLFLGPDEVRACCKRFFVNGIRKGDVVLMKADESTGLPQIQAAKQALIERINTGSAPECSGCPYLERRPAQPTGIDYLSLENFAYCNMRCSYCSPTYYGGTEARYNAAAIVGALAAQPNGFQPHCHVVWGGGEPTLSPRFEPINASLAALPQSGKIRVLSNSLKYSASLAARLHDPRFHLVTSVDAGTEATFRALRGKPGLADVLDNLVRYRQAMDDPRRLTVKYIVGAHNHGSDELAAYVGHLAGSPLLDCLFQVSCDFTLDTPEDDLVCALYELALRLLNQGAAQVFFDDLVRDRVRMTAERAARIQRHLADRGIDRTRLITPDAGVPVVLWGAGKQAQWLSAHTLSGQSGRLCATVQNAQDLQQLFGPGERLAAQPPRAVAILPAGVQSMHDILRNIERAGLGAQVARQVVL